MQPSGESPAPTPETEMAPEAADEQIEPTTHTQPETHSEIPTSAEKESGRVVLVVRPTYEGWLPRGYPEKLAGSEELTELEKRTIIATEAGSKVGYARNVDLAHATLEIEYLGELYGYDRNAHELQVEQHEPLIRKGVVGHRMPTVFKTHSDLVAVDRKGVQEAAAVQEGQLVIYEVSHPKYGTWLQKEFGNTAVRQWSQDADYLNPEVTIRETQ